MASAAGSATATPPATSGITSRSHPDPSQEHATNTTSSIDDDVELARRRALMLAISSDDSPYSEIENGLIADAEKRIAEFLANDKKEKVRNSNHRRAARLSLLWGTPQSDLFLLLHFLRSSPPPADQVNLSPSDVLRPAHFRRFPHLRLIVDRDQLRPPRSAGLRSRLHGSSSSNEKLP